MNYALQFDRETAIRVANLLEKDGDLKTAANVCGNWLGRIHTISRRTSDSKADLYLK